MCKYYACINYYGNLSCDISLRVAKHLVSNSESDLNVLAHVFHMLIIYKLV